MILLVHLLFGAAIGSLVKSMPMAILLAFLSHYLLDVFPHIEYDIENIKNKRWQKSFPSILKVILDFCLGIILILIFSKNQPLVFICALVAIIPDGLTLTNYIMPNKILELNDNIHKKIHFLKDEKISTFWRIVSQITVVIFSLFLLKI
jgi:hypothetical protein